VVASMTDAPLLALAPLSWNNVNFSLKSRYSVNAVSVSFYL
jgi:hypothetical protein